MSGVTWPKIGVIPAPLPEHATHLKHEATTYIEAFVGLRQGIGGESVEPAGNRPNRSRIGGFGSENGLGGAKYHYNEEPA